jgi:phosphonate transport system ATP-binding protein
MSAGKVVFEGTPDELTTEVARASTVPTGSRETFSEAMTSTSIALCVPLRWSVRPASDRRAVLPVS